MSNVLGIILARAGSKGLPRKNWTPLLGKPVIAYTAEHALASRSISTSVMTSDSPEVLDIARRYGLQAITRPPSLATDSARVDDVLRHALHIVESTSGPRFEVVVLLYGNVPIRDASIIDRAVKLLIDRGADSVRSVARVTKQHPDWIFRLNGDRLLPFRDRDGAAIHRRQDLEPLYYHDGAVVAVTRAALMIAEGADDPHAFFGHDRRAVVQEPDATVDIDSAVDLRVAEAILGAPNITCGTDVSPVVPPAGRRCHIEDLSGSLVHSSRDGELTFTSPAIDPIAVGTRYVGRRHSSYVIAEAGVNHDGSVDRALELVETAKSAGADAVKFQWFRAKELVTATASTASYQKQNVGVDRQEVMLAKLELSINDFTRIREHCRHIGIDFLATPFSIKALRQLLHLDPVAIKLASTDLNDVLLQRAVCDSKLPMFVSTGAATAIEIDDAVQRIREHGAADRCVLMHCVSRYPVPLTQVNLGAIRSLRERYAMNAGFSDHTESVEAGAWAAALGACVIEKHFTWSRHADGPDHAMSLEPAELAEYVRRIRDFGSAMGTGHLGHLDIEHEVRLLSRKSLVTLESIPAGAPLTSSAITAKRPGYGISPDQLDMLLGRRARYDIDADQVLEWDMIE